MAPRANSGGPVCGLDAYDLGLRVQERSVGRGRGLHLTPPRRRQLDERLDLDEHPPTPLAPSPRARDLAVDDEGRLEHHVAPRHDLDEVLRGKNHVAGLVAEEELVPLREQEDATLPVGGGAGVDMRDPRQAVDVLAHETMLDEAEGLAGQSERLEQPAGEVLLGDGSVAAYIALGHGREGLLAGRLAGVGDPRVDEDEAGLPPDERALADEAGHAVVADEVVVALAGRVDAVLDQHRGHVWAAHRLAQELLEERAGELDVVLGEPELGEPGGERRAPGRGQQLAHPAGVLGRHPVDRAAHRPGAYDLAVTHRLLDLLEGEARADAEGPCTAAVVLGLQGPELASHPEGRARCGAAAGRSSQSERSHPGPAQPATVRLVHQLRQAGPSRALRSPKSADVAVTRSESSSDMSTDRPGWVSLTWTSVAPGCSPRTRLRLSATAGVARPSGSVSTTGPRGPSLMSGMVSSCAKIEIESSRALMRPLTAHTVSWASIVE